MHSSPLPFFPYDFKNWRGTQWRRWKLMWIPYYPTFKCINLYTYIGILRYIKDNFKEFEKQAHELSSSDYHYVLSVLLQENENIQQIKRDSEEDLKSIIDEKKTSWQSRKIHWSAIQLYTIKVSPPWNTTCSQNCRATNCRECTLIDTEPELVINNMKLKSAKSLECKSRSTIYYDNASLVKKITAIPVAPLKST